MKNHLSFFIVFGLLSIGIGCSNVNEPDLPMDPPQCPRRFPDLADWGYTSITLKEPAFSSLTGIYFEKEGKGIVSTYEEIWKNDNDGKSWQQVYNGPISNLDNMIFSDPKHGFITGVYDHRACLLTTKDAGWSWDSIYFPNYQYINKISFGDSLRGVAIFEDHNYKVFLLKTKDGGHLWEEINEIPYVWYYAEINLTSSGFGYFPSKGNIFFTDDYGDSWTKLETGFNSLQALHFLDRQIGFAGLYKAIVKTEDGGMTWDTISHYPAELIHFFSKEDGISIQVVDYWWDYDVENECLAFASTHDGGVTWNIGDATSAGVFHSPSYIDSNTIFGITNHPEFNLVEIFR